MNILEHAEMMTGLPNLIGVLSLAWARILSSWLVELLQQENLKASYISSTACW
jgi:hypothetical protein